MLSCLVRQYGLLGRQSSTSASLVRGTGRGLAEGLAERLVEGLAEGLAERLGGTVGGDGWADPSDRAKCPHLCTRIVFVFRLPGFGGGRGGVCSSANCQRLCVDICWIQGCWLRAVVGAGQASFGPFDRLIIATHSGLRPALNN